MIWLSKKCVVFSCEPEQEDPLEIEQFDPALTASEAEREFCDATRNSMTPELMTRIEEQPHPVSGDDESMVRYKKLYRQWMKLRYGVEFAQPGSESLAHYPV